MTIDPKDLHGLKIMLSDKDSMGYQYIMDASQPAPQPPAQVVSYAVLAQRDPRWAAKLLGNDPVSTIGEYGCLDTCMAMAAGVLPDAMNDALKAAGNFAARPKGAYMADFDILKACQQIAAPRPVRLAKVTDTWAGEVPAAALAEIRAHIRAGQPAIIEVDSIPTTSRHEQHFVLATGIRATGAIMVNDPWYAEHAPITARYGATEPRAIWRAILYKFL